MVSRKDRKGQIRPSIIFIIILVFLLMVSGAIFFKLRAPERFSIEIFISELILIIIFPLLMFFSHILLISREIKKSHLNLSSDHAGINNSINNLRHSIDTMLFPEITALKITAEKEMHEKKKILKMLQDCLAKRQKESTD